MEAKHFYQPFIEKIFSRNPNSMMDFPTFATLPDDHSVGTIA
jgi:hypothetical protein